MNVEEGPYSWKESLAPWFLCLIYAGQLFFIAVTSYGSAVEGEYTIAILNVIGLGVVVIGAGGENPYCGNPVRYKGNNIRIPLTTTFNAKTIYILPSRTHGFDAVWGAKISFEHKELDQNVPNWFGTLLDEGSTNWSLYKCSVITKGIITAHGKRAMSVTDAELEALARWIYCCDEAGRPAVQRSARADRLDGVNLVGKDLLFALMSTEYLVYSLRYRLPPDLQTEYAKLRSTKFDGAENRPKTEVVAFGFNKRGKEGYQTAVQHLYEIFRIHVDASAMDPQGAPPSYSRALRYAPVDMDDYVSRLWDMCIDNAAEITTFGALFNFAYVWYLEVGEGNGFYIYPFGPKNDSY